MQSWLANDDWVRGRRDSLQRAAAQAFLTAVLGGIMRMTVGIVCMMSVRIVRVVCAGVGVPRVPRMLLARVRLVFAAMRVATKKCFQVAGRNACHPNRDTPGRNDPGEKRKLWLAVSHELSHRFCAE